MDRKFSITFAALAAFTTSLIAQNTYTVTTIAGTGPVGREEGRNRGDGGPASAAQLGTPGSLQIDSRGNLYVMVVDASYSPFVRRIDSNGIIDTVQSPTFPMFLRPNGDLMYYVSSWYGIAEIDSSGVPREQHIQLPNTYSSSPEYIAANQQGDLFLANFDAIWLLQAGDDRYRTINPPPVYRSVSRLVNGLAIDPAGRLYLFGGNGIYRMEPDRTFTSIAPRYCDGSEFSCSSPVYTAPDGPAGTARVGEILGLVFDSNGNAFFTEQIPQHYVDTGCKVRMMAPDLSIRTIAGGDVCRYQDGPGLQASFANAAGIAIDRDGNLYVADTDANRIRKLTPNNPPSSNMRIVGITQAATYQANQLAPGSVFTLFGDNIGPAALTTMQVANGKAVTNLSGVRILFDGVPAPLLYVAAKQASGVVPFGLSGKSTKAQVEYRGTRSAAFDLALVPSEPGFFTADGSGTGAAAALNENGTVNTLENPAKRGSVVVLYATGFGTMTPAADDGTIVTSLAAPQAAISVVIDGVEAQVLYAGAAPGLVAGVMQLNVRIPASSSGAREIRVRAGMSISPQGVVVFVAAP